jgi:hypothetical protein
MITSANVSSSIAGGPVDETKVTLSLRSLDLDPEEVTRSTGIMPTRSRRRGDAVGSGRSETHLDGFWSYEHKVLAPEEANAALSQLLGLLPADDAFWSSLREEHDVTLSLTMVVKAWNRGFALDAGLVQELGRRGLALVFEVYAEPQQLASACFA